MPMSPQHVISTWNSPTMKTGAQELKWQIELLPTLTQEGGFPASETARLLSPEKLSWVLLLTFRLETGSAWLWSTSSFSKRWRLLATPVGATKTSVREEPWDLTDSDLWKQRHKPLSCDHEVHRLHPPGPRTHPE